MAAAAASEMRLVPPRRGHVFAQVVGGVGEPAEETSVGGQLAQPAGLDGAEQRDRVLADRLPEAGVDLGEKVQRLGVP